jgi:hypothetical protein
MRNGDIAADKTLVRKAFEKPLESRGRSIHALVRPHEAIALEPVAVDQRRAGMPDRMADDEGLGHRHDLS